MVFALLSLAGAGHGVDPAKYMGAQLIAETASPKPGSTFLVGFRMTPKPGWHGYWSNPGDSGIAPSVRWTLPAGVSAGSLLHPPPKLLLADGISSFVHTGPHMLLVRISVARSLAAGTRIPLKADLSWAACTESQCVPLHEIFSLDLVAGNGTPGTDAGALRGAQAQVPRGGFHGTVSTAGANMRLALPPGLRLDPRTTRFFPDGNGVFHTAAARAARADGAVEITGPAGVATNPRALSGVVTDGASAYRITFAPREAPPPPSGPETRATDLVKVVAADPTPSASASAAAGAGPRQSPSRSENEPPRWPWVLAAGAIFVLAMAAVRGRRH